MTNEFFEPAAIRGRPLKSVTGPAQSTLFALESKATTVEGLVSRPISVVIIC